MERTGDREYGAMIDTGIGQRETKDSTRSSLLSVILAHSLSIVSRVARTCARRSRLRLARIREEERLAVLVDAELADGVLGVLRHHEVREGLRAVGVDLGELVRVDLDDVVDVQQRRVALDQDVAGRACSSGPGRWPGR